MTAVQAVTGGNKSTWSHWQPTNKPGATASGVAALVGRKPHGSEWNASRLLVEKDTPLADPSPGPAGHGGGFAVLTLQGLEPDTITETFHSRMPTPSEVQQLELPAGEPVMILHRTASTRKGQVVEFARGVHSASRFSWSYTFTMPD